MIRETNYCIMHGEETVAEIGTNGICRIDAPSLMPYDLYLEEGPLDDLDLRMQNLENFYHFCASRVLMMDRRYAKEILGSIGASQAGTDRARAGIALSYHCLALTDVFWVKTADEDICYADINLLDNHLSNAFVDISLRGKQMTVTNSSLIAQDLSTSGVFAKAWIRREDGFWLLKDGDPHAVAAELAASRIAQCFRLNQVVYRSEMFEGMTVSASRLITSAGYGMATAEAYEIYCANHDLDRMKSILDLDAYGYHMMNVVDYLIGNTDRHWGNWGVLVRNTDNCPLRLYDLMDFNHAFEAYDTPEGGRCQTTVPLRNLSQKDAAIEGVRAVGLNCIRIPERELFLCDSDYEMFLRRLRILKNQGD